MGTRHPDAGGRQDTWHSLTGGNKIQIICNIYIYIYIYIYIWTLWILFISETIDSGVIIINSAKVYLLFGYTLPWYINTHERTCLTSCHEFFHWINFLNNANLAVSLLLNFVDVMDISRIFYNDRFLFLIVVKHLYIQSQGVSSADYSW